MFRMARFDILGYGHILLRRASFTGLSFSAATVAPFDPWDLIEGYRSRLDSRRLEEAENLRNDDCVLPTVPGLQERTAIFRNIRGVRDECGV